MTEISPEERRKIWLGGFECMARIHRLDYRETGFDFLEQPQWGDTPLERQINQYKRYLEWAARGHAQPTAEAALEWLEKNKPQNEPTGIVWGDARIGNVIFSEGGAPAAVVDWEMVTLGSPETDFGWAIFVDRHHSEGLGLPRLEGFPRLRRNGCLLRATFGPQGHQSSLLPGIRRLPVLRSSWQGWRSRWSITK